MADSAKPHYTRLHEIACVKVCARGHECAADREMAHLDIEDCDRISTDAEDLEVLGRYVRNLSHRSSH